MHDKIAEKIFNRFHNDVAGFASAFTNIFYDVDGRKQDLYPLQVEFMNLARPQERIVAVVKCRQCVPGDTLIYTEDGQVSIKELFDSGYRGRIFTFNGEHIQLDNVEDVWETGEKELLEITTGEYRKLRCTPEHKVYVNGNWIKAKDVKIGDTLNTFDDYFVSGNYGETMVKYIAKIDELHQTYDMTVANTHNYYANGILVHNSGFTTSIKAKAIHGAFFGKVPNFLIASASQLQASKVLREIKEAFRSMPEAIMPEFEKDTETELHLASGPKLVSLPANPQTVRGFSGAVALDEFGVLNRKDSEALYEALLPTLVKGYNMVVVSTPRGKNNLFYDLCNPKYDDNGEIVGIRADKIIRVHWTEVPHIKKAVLEMDLENKMTKKSFLQEFCCEFVDEGDNSLFDAELIKGRFVDRGLEFIDASGIEFVQGDICPEKLIRHDVRSQYDSVFIGFDPAISFDGSCVSVWGVKNNEWVQIFLRVLPKGMEVSAQCDYVSRLAQFFNATKVGLDSTGGMGLAFLQRLRDTRIGHLVLPITFTSILKTKEYAEIKNKMQGHVMKSPEHHEMIKQFMNLNYNPVTGRIAAAGSWRDSHDDIPSAILCAHACRSKRNNSGFSII